MVMEENKNKFEMPDVDELEKKLDEPVEKKYELPDELKEKNDMINPVNKVGPNGATSTKQNGDYIPEFAQYTGDEPGRPVAMRGMILGICNVALTIVAICFSGMTVVANIINIIALLCGIGGIVFGVVGGNQNVSYGAPRGAIATAGIVCGVLGILLSGAAFAIVAACSGLKNFFGF